MTTDTTEKGLEALIVRAMTGRTDVLAPAHVATETSVPVSGGTGWLLGDASNYDREYAIDLVQLRGFLRATQEPLIEALGLDADGPTRRKFLARLQGEISKRGTIDVLRKGLKHGPHTIDLFYGTPSPGNATAATRYAANRFSVTRQLRYSLDEKQRALDLALFVNGLPVADAVQQYQCDREPRERLFEFGRCVVHFAVDDHEVRFCTHLRGKPSWFLPFNLGWSDGAGNPPNPDGLKTDYLWKRILTREGLTDRGRAQARSRPGAALQDPEDVQRAVRPDPVDGQRPGQEADHGRHPEPGCGRRGLPERHEELGPAERADRARQGAGPGDDGHPQGRHRALQAVHGQRIVPPLVDRRRLRAHLRPLREVSCPASTACPTP